MAMEFSVTLTKKHLHFMSFNLKHTKLDCELISTITVPIISDGIGTSKYLDDIKLQTIRKICPPLDLTICFTEAIS